jgi:hypothetical protein
MQSNENPFKDAVIVASYTDRQAVADGLLVPINHRDRVTRTVWDSLREHMPVGSQPPANWPVELLGWFKAEIVTKAEALKILTEHGAEEGQKQLNSIIADRKALAMAKGLISQHEPLARRQYDEGGIYKLYAFKDENNRFYDLQPRNTSGMAVLTFWLMPNENGGITLMFPEDY